MILQNVFITEGRFNTRLLLFFSLWVTPHRGVASEEEHLAFIDILNFILVYGSLGSASNSRQSCDEHWYYSVHREL